MFEARGAGETFVQREHHETTDIPPGLSATGCGHIFWKCASIWTGLRVHATQWDIIRRIKMSAADRDKAIYINWSHYQKLVISIFQKRSIWSKLSITKFRSSIWSDLLWKDRSLTRSLMIDHIFFSPAHLSANEFWLFGAGFFFMLGVLQAALQE